MTSTVRASTEKGRIDMRLQRRKNLSHVKYEQESTNWNTYDGVEVFVDFMNFGKGVKENRISELRSNGRTSKPL